MNRPADQAMDTAVDTMLQSFDLSLDDFDQLEGCNEILNVTRPDVVREVHRGYLEAGADAVETNTFGCNAANLAEHDIEDRIFELSETGARLARETADEFAEPDRPRFVLRHLGAHSTGGSAGSTSEHSAAAS